MLGTEVIFFCPAPLGIFTAATQKRIELYPIEWRLPTRFVTHCLRALPAKLQFELFLRYYRGNLVTIYIFRRLFLWVMTI